MKACKTFLFVIFLTGSCYASHLVYLIHGFGSHAVFMLTLESAIKKGGFDTRNYQYDSFQKDLTLLGNELYKTIKNDTIDTVSFVTHSMGALVVRSMLRYSVTDSLFPKIFRIVMLTPPNHGAQIADFFSKIQVLNWVLGPNLKNMRTDSSSLANHLPIPINCETGIIVGAKFDGVGYNPFIKGDNDGYLSVDKTDLKSKKEMITIPEAHTFMTMNKSSNRYVLHFLKYGNFTKE